MASSIGRSRSAKRATALRANRESVASPMAYIEQWLSTMSLVLRRKRFKFQVDFFLADMCNVPFVNGVLYSKIRLHDGGSFCDFTSRVDVVNHHVYWGKVSRFICRIGSDLHSGMLEPCKCRVSVRKEVKCGRSFQKLGYVDINLSEFAGCGIDGQTRTYLLEGYDAGQQRQDNSLIRVNISMVLLSSDPFFKVPPHVQQSATTTAGCSSELSTAAVGQELAAMSDRASVTSVSSGFESLNRGASSLAQKSLDGYASSHSVDVVKGRHDFDDHCKNASRTSQLSDYASSSVSHSRQSSTGSSQAPRVTASFADNMSTIFASNKASTVKKVPSADVDTAREFDSSRVDAVELITELLKDYNTTTVSTVMTTTTTPAATTTTTTTASTDECGKGNKEPQAGTGLKLYISKDDGSTAIVGSSENLPVLSSKRFTQVVMEPPPAR